VKVELKNLKIHRDMSQETTCFSATLYIDNVKVGEASNTGRGGNNMVRMVDFKLQRKFEDYCRSLPPYQDLPMDRDLFISLLVEKTKEDQYLVRTCKKKTVFSLKDQEEGVWYTINDMYSQEVKDFLVKKYGYNLKEVANERSLLTNAVC